MKKIDWLNHFVAFASSLLGILIAFQLDNWRESRGENEKMQIALQGIKKEIENNSIKREKKVPNSILAFLNLISLIICFSRVRVNSIPLHTPYRILSFDSVRVCTTNIAS